MTLGQETRWAYCTTLPSPHLYSNCMTEFRNMFQVTRNNQTSPPPLYEGGGLRGSLSGDIPSVEGVSSSYFNPVVLHVFACHRVHCVACLISTRCHTISQQTLYRLFVTDRSCHHSAVLPSCCVVAELLTMTHQNFVDHERSDVSEGC